MQQNNIVNNSVVVLDFQDHDNCLAERYITKSGREPKLNWRATFAPRGYFSIGGGVAFLEGSDQNYDFGTYQAQPRRYSTDRYGWSENTESGLHYIIIFPDKYVLQHIDDAKPHPVEAKVFQGRMALYWTIVPDNNHIAAVTFKMSEAKKTTQEHCQTINDQRVESPTLRNPIFDTTVPGGINRSDIIFGDKYEFGTMVTEGSTAFGNQAKAHSESKGESSQLEMSQTDAEAISPLSQKRKVSLLTIVVVTAISVGAVLFLYNFIYSPNKVSLPPTLPPNTSVGETQIVISPSVERATEEAFVPLSSTVPSQTDNSVILIPGGTFTMGSTDEQLNRIMEVCAGSTDCNRDTLRDLEYPYRTVTLSSYYLNKYEVTNQQYAECVEAGVCDLPQGELVNYFHNPDKANHPVVNIDWNDASAYCQWRGGDLPTEAQWEFAARGEENLLYPWGDNHPHLGLLNYNNDEFGEIAAVGSFEGDVSPFGIYDMGGNVFEWVRDWYGKYESGTYIDPPGREEGSERVIRSGSYQSSIYVVRAAYRFSRLPTFINEDLGFRCARDAE